MSKNKARINTITIYYDNECPVCRSFTSYLKMKNDFDEVNIIGMRTLSKEELSAIAAESGADLNKGILVKIYSDGKNTYLSRAKAAAFIGNYSSNLIHKMISRLLKLQVTGNMVYTLVYRLRLILLKIKNITSDIY